MDKTIQSLKFRQYSVCLWVSLKELVLAKTLFLLQWAFFISFAVHNNYSFQRYIWSTCSLNLKICSNCKFLIDILSLREILWEFWFQVGCKRRYKLVTYFPHPYFSFPSYFLKNATVTFHTNFRHKIKCCLKSHQNTYIQNCNRWTKLFILQQVTIWNGYFIIWYTKI